MTIDTYPRGRKDSKASIYFYDDEKKYTRRRVTKWKNTREGKSEAK